MIVCLKSARVCYKTHLKENGLEDRTANGLIVKVFTRLSKLLNVGLFLVLDQTVEYSKFIND